MVKVSCPTLAPVPHKDLADVLAAYADLIGQYLECRQAALGAVP